MGTAGWIVIGVIALLVIIVIVMYNRLVRFRNRIDAAWSQIDVQLKRRYDLIPNLVETVKGYATHERETFEQVTRARQQAVDARGIENQAQAENFLTQALRQLLAVAEAYPQLQANQNFLVLQEELTGTEGRIAFARQFYNEQVLVYDNAIEVFPTNVVAGAFGFKERAYFEPETASREPVRVDFPGPQPPDVGPAGGSGGAGTGGAGGAGAGGAGTGGAGAGGAGAGGAGGAGEPPTGPAASS